MTNIILFGLKSSGKTYWGQRISQELGLAFVDTDNLVEDLFEEMHGQRLSCREIYLKMGKLHFSTLEYEALLLLKPSNKTLISVGGGTLFSQKNLQHLRQIGRLVYLKVCKEVLKKRILSGTLPAYFDPERAISSFEKMYEERSRVYEKIPAYVMPISELSEEQIFLKFKEVCGQ